MRKEPSRIKALKSRITDQQSIAITFGKTLGNHHRFARILDLTCLEGVESGPQASQPHCIR